MESILIAIAAVGPAPFMRRTTRPAATKTGGCYFAVPSLSGIPIAAAPALPDAYWQDTDSNRQPADQGAQEDAEQILGDLGRVQVDLLHGRIDLAGLRRIGSLAKGLAAVDPDLNDICKAIAMRARVEVARVEVAAQGKYTRNERATSPALLFR